MYDKYKNDYSILPNEAELVKDKNEEFKLFYKYVRKIYIRCKKAGLSHGRILWEDFPYDLYEDIRSWINKETVKEIKEYIDQLKAKYPCVCESAKLFWAHWLAYKSITNKNNNK